MMRGYQQITWRYLKGNKRRAILTIIGIILSVSLISSIGLFIKGMQEVQIEDAKSTYGSYHLYYKSADKELIDKVSNNPRVARSGTYTLGKEIKVGNITISELTATNEALELLPFRAKEGRLPQSENEVAVEGWVLRNIQPNAKIGDSIEVGNNEYVLVGILENNIQQQINSQGIILTKNNKLNQETVLLVEISPKTSLNRGIKELSALVPPTQVYRNVQLIAAEGGADNDSNYSGLYFVVGVIIFIVVISTIAVIYNAFQISVVERMKQLGLLRAVGTTPKQIRRIVLREATFLAIIGIPIGLLAGISAIYIIGFVFRLIGGDDLMFFKPVISSFVIVGSGLVGLFSIYLSALLPAFFAGRISPLVAISSRVSITKEKVRKRKNPFISKIFGFETNLAYKNIKRNRKRYRITVFSIVISVMLFISFSSFMDMSFSASRDINESQNVQFSIVRDIQGNKDNTIISSDVIQQIKSLPSVKSVYKVYHTYPFETTIDKDKEIKELQEVPGIYRSVENNQTAMNSTVAIYDKEALEVSKKYLKAGNINLNDLNKENGVILIVKNRVFNPISEKSYYGPIADLHVGDEIKVNDFLGSEGKINNGIKKLKVLAIVNDEIFNFVGSQYGLKLITSEQVAEKFVGKEELKPINLNITIKDIKKEKEANDQLAKIINSHPSLTIINRVDSNRHSKSLLLMARILIYGFVVVVSLIGSVNIINTLTTNILLRKREFATLRSIGLSYKGLRKMIISEGLIYGMVGAFYGSIVGILLSYVMYHGLISVREFPWTIPWSTIGIATAASLIIGYFSVLSPLSRIKGNNLIQDIREDY